MDKILTKKEVAKLTSYSTRHIERLVARGHFPAPLKLHDAGARIGWLESEISDWIYSRQRRLY